tara:strand:+ start:1217 stop:1756 length:540 start_codon:yes stop_codon:yes gene_type:complete
MNDTDLIFFTGVPGSKWSGIAREIKQDPRYDTSDRAPHRVYEHNEFSGHKESYFGTGMEFPVDLNIENLLAPFNSTGIKLLMSHEWPYYFDQIINQYPTATIKLVYRPNDASLDWWLKAGGFDITYPNYDWYVDEAGMRKQIAQQNKLILDFAQEHMLQWVQHNKHNDVFLTEYKPYES